MRFCALGFCGLHNEIYIILWHNKQKCFFSGFSLALPKKVFYSGLQKAIKS